MIQFQRRQIIHKSKHLIVKVGTNVLTADNGLLNRERIRYLVEELCAIRAKGVNVTLVSSGAVGAGMGRLGLSERPKFHPQLQATAAIGQGALIQCYEEELNSRNVLAAQVLLTAEDLSERERYINICNTFNALLNYGALPIVNENDTVSSAELCMSFGDNDRLAALVANLFPEPLLVLLTDVDGLFNGDPSLPESKLITNVEHWSPDLMGMVAEKKSTRSKGGMSSKLKAAQIVTYSGGSMIIANGDDPHILSKIYANEDCGTFFFPQGKLSARKRWFSFTKAPAGILVVDDGAAKVIEQGGKSLLPVGVLRCIGNFHKGDVVSIVNQTNREIARGLSNYAFEEVEQICGKTSHKIEHSFGRELFPYEEIVHRNNIQLMDEAY